MKKQAILFCAVIGMSHCAWAASGQPGQPGIRAGAESSAPGSLPSSLDALEGLSSSDAPKPADIRSKAIREAGLRIGLCGGANDGNRQLVEKLDLNGARLDQIFNFSSMLMAGDVLPPVIIESRDNATTNSSGTAMSLDWVDYRILKPARIVRTAPTWRDYLYLPVHECAMPPAGLLPKTGAEKKVWRQAVAEGWQHGEAAIADEERQALRELTRDYVGMIRFRILRQQKLVAMPVVAGSRPRVIVQGRELEIGQQLFRIMKPEGFQGTGEWNPVAVPSREEPKK